MKDWNKELESVGCRYSYEEIRQILDTYLNTLSSHEFKIIKKDIDELLTQHQIMLENPNG